VAQPQAESYVPRLQETSKSTPINIFSFFPTYSAFAIFFFFFFLKKAFAIYSVGLLERERATVVEVS
jgi:hypothetical protein